jgi:hypothetical protein
MTYSNKLTFTNMATVRNNADDKITQRVTSEAVSYSGNQEILRFL